MTRRSVLSHLIRTVGPREGWHAARFLVAYLTVRAHALHAGDPWPSDLEPRLALVGDVDGTRRGTQYRRLQPLREAFPDYHDPEDLVLALEALHGSYEPEAVLALDLEGVIA